MNQIKRDISTIQLMFISFTAMFGSGWLFAPFFAAQIAGPASLVAWIVGALISMVIGITMAEIILLFPESPGLNIIAQTTHGKLIGFLNNVLMLIVCIILPVIEVRAIMQYLSTQSNVLMTGSHVTLLGFLIAGVLLILINFINIYGAKVTARINSLSVFFKLIAPVTICFVFLVSLFHHGLLTTDNLKPFKLHWNEIFLAISTSGIIFSFNGFNQATLFAAESKNPRKSIPIAIVGSILFATALYLFIQYVLLVAIPKSAIEHGWALLKFSGDSGPFSGLALLLGLHGLLYFIYVDAVVSPLGTAFTYSSAAPRMLYAAAMHSRFLPVLRELNLKGIPQNAVILTLLCEFIAFILLPNLKAMISILVCAFVLNYTVAPMSLLYLRKRIPDVKRPFKIPFAPLFCFLSLFFANIMAYFCGFDSLRNLVVVVLLTYAIGIIFYVFSKEKVLESMKGANWFVFQLLVLTGLAYLSELKIITFLDALAAIAASCLITMFLALRYKEKEIDLTKLESIVTPSP